MLIKLFHPRRIYALTPGDNSHCITPIHKYFKLIMIYDIKILVNI